MIELEKKALIKNPEQLIADIENYYDMSICSKEESTQVNSYFQGEKSALEKLLDSYKGLESRFWNLNVKETLLNATTLAIRTRQDSVKGVLLIFKYSLINQDADNGTERKELEFTTLHSLDELEAYLLSLGFSYKSKWSRKRIQYSFNTGWTLCVDHNAGYEGVFEVEYMANEEEYSTKKDWLMYKANRFLDQLGLTEINPELLKRMYSFYTKHWEHFFGKDIYIWNDPRFPYKKDGSNLNEFTVWAD